MSARNTFAFRVLLAVLAVAALTLNANAATILDTGLIAFSPPQLQFGRLNRNGISSDWSGPKAFPGVFGAPAT